jgi:hypothetical protein
VTLDPEQKTITLIRPLLLDLGAVAKGLAIDLAARELADFRNYAIDAGGDLFMAGHNAAGQPWSVGIRHPRRDGEIIERVRVSAPPSARQATTSDEARTPDRDITFWIRGWADRPSRQSARRWWRRRRCSPTHWRPPRSCSARLKASDCWNATAWRCAAVAGT